MKNAFEKIFVEYTQIRQSNTNTNISSCGFSNTNTNTDICVFKYKYVFDPSPVNECMAMEMGNIKLMVKSQVFIYIRGQRVVHRQFTPVTQ